MFSTFEQMSGLSKESVDEIKEFCKLPETKLCELWIDGEIMVLDKKYRGFYQKDMEFLTSNDELIVIGFGN